MSIVRERRKDLLTFLSTFYKPSVFLDVLFIVSPLIFMIH